MDSLSPSLGIDTSIMGSEWMLSNSNSDQSLSKGDEASTTIVMETVFAEENNAICKENIENENITEVGGSNHCELGSSHARIQFAVKGLQGKKKRKNINDILGFTKVKQLTQIQELVEKRRNVLCLGLL